MSTTLNHSYETFKQLAQAVFQLEDAIISAKNTIQSKSHYPPEAIERLDHYMEMVEQQKSAFPSIMKCLTERNFGELSIEIRRVNALSEMIKDDAKELLGVLANPTLKPLRPDPN